MIEDEPKGLTIKEMGSVQDRILALGLAIPEGVTILPRAFFWAKDKSELLYEHTTPDLKVLFRQAKLPVGKIEPDGVKILYIAEHDQTLVLPVFFVGAALWSQSPELVNVALGVVANYVTDWFRGRAGNNRIKCGTVIEKSKSTTTAILTYDGPPEKFDTFISAVKEMTSKEVTK